DMAGIEQRKDFHHKDVFLHTLLVVDNVAKVSSDLWLRFAALVHDIAKPQTKKFVEGTGWTFHGHEEIGAKMMKSVFKKLKLPFSKLEYIEKLVRLHLRPIALVSEEVTDSAIRRFIVSAGDDLEDLITLCRADITSKQPVKVAKYLENYEKVMNKVREVEEKDKLKAFQSPVRGETIMEVCNLPPSKKVGEIKKAIEEAILDGKIGNNYEEAYQYLLKIKDNFINNDRKV
ncbi:MAG: HD domain-containing protein, partial [Ignavibacteria bacterium]